MKKQTGFYFCLFFIPGALSKELLIREEDVQVLHGFKSVADAKAYLVFTYIEDERNLSRWMNECDQWKK
jgi:hypothetical protein